MKWYWKLLSLLLFSFCSKHISDFLIIPAPRKTNLFTPSMTKKEKSNENCTAHFHCLETFEVHIKQWVCVGLRLKSKEKKCIFQQKADCRALINSPRLGKYFWKEWIRGVFFFYNKKKLCLLSTCAAAELFISTSFLFFVHLRCVRHNKMCSSMSWARCRSIPPSVRLKQNNDLQTCFISTLSN